MKQNKNIHSCHLIWCLLVGDHCVQGIVWSITSPCPSCLTSGLPHTMASQIRQEIEGTHLTLFSILASRVAMFF